MEPKILLVGKILPIMDILRDELNANYGRDVISSASKEHVLEVIAAEKIDLVILGAGFDDETRDDVAVAVSKAQPELEIFKVPRVGEKSPAKLVSLVNNMSVEWKFMKAMGGKPGGPMGGPKGGPGGKPPSL